MNKIYSTIATILILIAAHSEVFSQYCNPSTSRTWIHISDVGTVGALNDISISGLSQNSGYTDMSASNVILAKPGQQFQMSVTMFNTSWNTRTRVWIDFNQDFTFSSNELVHNGNSMSQPNPRSFFITIPSNTNIVKSGTTRMRIMNSSAFTPDPCQTGSWPGSAVDVAIRFPPNNSTNVAALVSPETPICSRLFQDLSVTICNDGLAKVDSVQVGGIIKTTDAGGNPLPPISVANFMVKDSLLPDSCKTFKIYTHSPGFKTNDTITIWTAMPNGVPDSLNLRDTVQFVIPPSVQTGKIWTVGNVNAGHDFPDLNVALNYFDSIGGICDTLIIELDSSQNKLRMQYEMPKLKGVHAAAPIIIRSKANIGGRATLRYDSTDVDNNYIFLLDDVEHIYFENIAFYSEDVYTTNNSTNISIIRGSHDIHFSNCTFGADYNNNQAENTLVIGDNLGSGGVEFTGCEFNRGSNALELKKGAGHKVESCQFNNTFLTGITIIEAADVIVTNNTFRSFSTNVYNGGNVNDMGNAIRLDKCSNNLQVSYNTVNTANSQWPRNGIIVSNYNKGAGLGHIYNNMVNVGQSWSSLNFRGIWLNNSSFTEMYYNNVAINGNNGGNAGFYYENGTGNTFINNISAIEVSGTAVVHTVFGSVTVSDHNNFYAPNNDIVRINGSGGGTFATLSAYQNATSLDANSFNVNPFYYDTKNNNLHVCNNALSKSGKVITGLTEDYDRDPRSATPSIGADQFTPISDVKLPADYGLCPGDSTRLEAGRGNFGETAIWKNITSNTVVDTNHWILVKQPAEYSVTFFNACGVVVDTIEIITPATVQLPNDTNICPNKTLVVDATIVNEDKYAWSTNDSSASITISSQATYMVTATDKWGCVTTDQFDVTYSPAAAIPQSDTVACDGTFFDLVSGVDQASGATFKWCCYPGSSSETDAGVSILASDLKNQDTVVVEVNHKGCITRDSVAVTKLFRPKVQVVDTVNGLLYKVITNSSPGSVHRWDFGDGDTSNFKAPKHIYAKAGLYKVKYTNSNVCGSATETFDVEVLVLSVENGSVVSTATIYPNPNNGNFNVSLNSLNAENIELSVIDLRGKTIHTENFGSVSGTINRSVNIESITPGVYTLILNVDGEQSAERIVIQ